MKKIATWLPCEIKLHHPGVHRLKHCITWKKLDSEQQFPVPFGLPTNALWS
jgi:hypothetical protein